MSDSGGRGFLSRWSQRKIQARNGHTARDEADAKQPPAPVDEIPAHGTGAAPVAGMPATGVSPQASASSPAAVEPAPVSGQQESPGSSLPSLEDVKRLTADSDFSPFVARGVAPAVRNAAMKKLFADPHFNVMDGLDIYIDDYTQREILPESMMRKMASSKFLNMFAEDDVAAQGQVAGADLSQDAPDEGCQAPAAETERDSPVPVEGNSDCTGTDVVSLADRPAESASGLSNQLGSLAYQGASSPQVPRSGVPSESLVELKQQVQEDPESSRVSPLTSEPSAGEAPSDKRSLERIHRSR